MIDLYAFAGGQINKEYIILQQMAAHTYISCVLGSEPWFNIKMASY